MLDSPGDDVIDVSIVLPCLNEEKSLPVSLSSARAALDTLQQRFGMRGEIVVADNGSTDRSHEIALSYSARIVPVARRGYGSAVRTGCLAAKGRFVVMGDSDGSYDFRDAVPMIEKLLDGDDLCVGSRFKGRIMPGAMPWKNRHLGNPALSGFLNVLFRTKISDAHCGLRAFTRASFLRLRTTSDGMEFASEMVIKASLMGMKISETPITLYPDARGTASHLRPWRDGWRHLRLLLMLSPGGLFFLPALLLLAIGAPVFCLLLARHDGAMSRLGAFRFGDHWMVASAAMLNMALQLALFAMATTLHGIRSGYRQARGLAFWFLSRLHLEHFLILGGALASAGLLSILWVLRVWADTDYGPLEQLRPMIAGVTFILLGMQLAFGGFFLSVINDNEARIDIRKIEDNM